MKKNADPISTSYVDIMEKNHMEIPWHDYTGDDSNVLISDAGLIEKASVIGRVGLILLSCGTGAWRVRTSMNKLSKELGVTCTVDVGLMSIEFNCFDGNVPIFKYCKYRRKHIQALPNGAFRRQLSEYRSPSDR